MKNHQYLTKQIVIDNSVPFSTHVLAQTFSINIYLPQDFHFIKNVVLFYKNLCP